MSNRHKTVAIAVVWGVAWGCLALSRFAHASVELDRRYALETVGFLKSWDNVDGLFTDYVANAYKGYFSRQSRFVLQDLSKADVILSNSSIPYQKLIQDNDILVQLARSTRSQSLIRTKVEKEGPQYRFTMEWLHSPEMEVMAREQFDMTEPRDGKGFGATELQAKLEQATDRMIHKLPFIGSVTGRDNNNVTVNIGTGSGVQPGDTLVVGTLEDVRKHPLLKEIVEWRISSTGKVTVEQAEDRLSFCRVQEEDQDRPIAKYQKITQVIHPPIDAAAPALEDKSSGSGPTPDEMPRIGWAGAGINLGGFGRDYNLLDNSIGKSGSGFLIGVKADSQIWFTHEWFGEMGLNFGSWGYSQNDTIAGSSGASTSLGTATLVNFKIAGGYSYLLNGDLFGPKGWLKLGYKSNAYDLPASAVDVSTPITFKTLFLGIGADLPVRGKYGALLDLDFGVFKSASESPQLAGQPTGVSDVAFTVGGYYRYTNHITLRATLDFQYNGADFTDRTLSQRVITFVPALLYYF